VRTVLSPRLWGAHVLALVLLAAAGTLAWWQYSAYDHQREAEARDLTGADPVALVDALGPDAPLTADLVGQPVEAEGAWLPDGTVYVEGREHDGEDGYWMVVPLAVEATGSALPVVLGWAPTPEAAPAPPEGPAVVRAWLQPTDGTGQVDTDRTDDVVPQVRVADLIQHVDRDLYEAYVVLDTDAGTPVDGLAAADLEQLPAPAGGTGLRNLLYAVEWVIFGGFAGFVWWRWVRDVTRRPEAPDAEDDAPAPAAVG